MEFDWPGGSDIAVPLADAGSPTLEKNPQAMEINTGIFVSREAIAYSEL